MPAPFRRPALLRICELEMWPKTMASTAAGKMKNKNPQIRLAMARPLVSCGPYCGAVCGCQEGCGGGACGGTDPAAENWAPQLLQNAAASSFGFVQAGQIFISASELLLPGDVPPS